MNSQCREKYCLTKKMKRRLDKKAKVKRMNNYRKMIFFSIGVKSLRGKNYHENNFFIPFLLSHSSSTSYFLDTIIYSQIWLKQLLKLINVLLLTSENIFILVWSPHIHADVDAALTGQGHKAQTHFPRMNGASMLQPNKVTKPRNWRNGHDWRSHRHS